MKTNLLVLILFFCSIQMFYSQEDQGVVALNIPLRNSLTFNRFNINPTFSFVREQNKYIGISNKREWTQFENAPLTYIASYSGRFGENIGAGLGVFQQNYGVLTTFGGILNFAYNVRLERDSNLTFGLNIGAYKSGLNTGKVVVNFDDPALQNIPENFLLTANPGLNYGNGFFDFGVALKNIVAYNLTASTMLEDNPEQSVQGHIMYTGYVNTRGFFDESKFSGLVKSEFAKNETIISAMAMLTVPKGIWAQVGYNTVYGASGGLGINISSQIAIEYNFEKAIGDLTNFGASHEITLAYRFENQENYEYSSGDEVAGLLSGNKRRKPKVKRNTNIIAERRAEAKKRLAEQKDQEAADTEAKRLAEQKDQEAADVEAKRLAEQKAQEAADAEAKRLAEQKAQEEAADAEAKRLAEQKAQEEADAEAKRLAEQKAQEAADAEAKRLAEQKAQEAADAEAKRLAEQKAQEAADAEAKRLAEQKAKEATDAEAKRLAEQKAQEAANQLVLNPTDELGKSMLALTEQTEVSKTTQSNLLERFDAIVEVKNTDLKNLKEENDLSEQGLTVNKPQTFKSITEENNKLKAIKSELDNVIANRNNKINELKSLYDDKFETDTISIDDVNLFYRKTIQRLELEQKEAIAAKAKLELRLEDIQEATEYERRRRIKRAAFDNEEERYTQDRATLQNIKKTTSQNVEAVNAEDFDYGEEQSNNILIIKDVKNVENGYYLVLAVHNDKNKRNDFVTKVIQSGRSDVDFFYDVKTSKYFIYTDKYDSTTEANNALKTKGNKPYNSSMSIVKIEN